MQRAKPIAAAANLKPDCIGKTKRLAITLASLLENVGRSTAQLTNYLAA
jgi:hypothetical protein